MNKILAVLFDLDGTLVDMCNVHFESLNRSLLRHGYNAVSTIHHKKFLDGLPSSVKLIKMEVPVDKRSSIIEWKQKYTIEAIENADLFELEIHKVMHWLKENFINIGVVTNSIRQTAEAALVKAGLLQYLDILVTSEDITYPKPISEGYIYAMVSLGIYPSECIIVEDNQNGITSGINTGATVLKVNSPKDIKIDLLKEFIV